jgi:hypothetical protein
MRIAIWMAISLLAFGLCTLDAQTPSQNQPATAPQGTMEGTELAPTPEHGQDASHCMNMVMGRCMDHGQAKPLVPSGGFRVAFGARFNDWSPAKLAALPHKTVTVYNDRAKASQTFSGVPLIDLLTLVGVPAKQQGKDLRLYLVAVGADGYQAVYSVAEVNPGIHDATVLVADSADGRPLTADGPLMLVSTAEKVPVRRVRNLVFVRVQTAQ